MILLPSSLGVIRAVAAVAAFGWNPSDKNANIVLSNSNRTATTSMGGTSSQGVRGPSSHNSGKWYLEYTASGLANNANNGMLGLATTAYTLNNVLGADTSGAAISSHGFCYLNGVANPTRVSSPYPGDTSAITQVAWDADAGYLWFGVNGTWKLSGNPAAGTSPALSGVTGTYFPAASALQSATRSITIRDRASDQTYSPPSGFSSWTP